MKGVILAGGTGSRLHPLTRITNKHLLPVYDKPMIFYPIETLVAAGIDDLMLVTGGNHAGEFLPLLGNGAEFGLKRLQFSYQARAGGIAEALGLCESFVDGDKVVVMLGDNILGETIAPYIDNFRKQRRGARILLKEMDDPAHLRHLGVPIFNKDDRLAYIREKPSNPPSPYAVIGVYMFDAEVFHIVRNLKPSGRGELEITDVNNAYVDRARMEYDVISGFWGDAGESIEVYYEVIDHVRRDGVLHPAGTARQVAQDATPADAAPSDVVAVNAAPSAAAGAKKASRREKWVGASEAERAMRRALSNLAVGGAAVSGAAPANDTPVLA